MKRRARNLILLAVLILLPTVALHVWLNHALTDLARRALRSATGEVGLNADVGHVAFNLPRGLLMVEGLSVANPDGFGPTNVFSVGRLRVNLGWLALVRGIVHLSEIDVDRARLTIVSNDRGEINAVALHEQVAAKLESVALESETAGPVESPPQPPAPEAVTPAAPTAPSTPPVHPPEWPRVRVDRLRIEGVTAYHATTAADEHAPVSLWTETTLTDFRTYGGTNDPWADLTLRGHLEDDPEACVLNMTGRVAPVTDPARPSFNLRGGLAALQPGAIQELGELGFQAEAMNLTVTLECRDGVFNPAVSRLTLTLREPRYDGRVLGRKRRVELPHEIQVVIPVGGTVEAPEVDWAGPLLNAVLQAALGSGGLLKF